MKEYLEIQKPELDYTYEFEVDQLSEMSECLAAHGFAIVKDVLPPELVDSLKQAVFDGTDPNRELEHGQSRTRHAWVESGPGAWQLLGYDPFMKIHRYLIGTDEMTVHRSAAIIRMPGISACCMAHRLVWVFDGRAEEFGGCAEPWFMALR